MHRPAGPPLGAPPVLVLATPDDRLVPIRGVRATARRYGADVVEFPGMGHDLMLDARWREPLDAMLGWLAEGDALSRQPTALTPAGARSARPGASVRARRTRLTPPAGWPEHRGPAAPGSPSSGRGPAGARGGRHAAHPVVR